MQQKGKKEKQSTKFIKEILEPIPSLDMLFHSNELPEQIFQDLKNYDLALNPTFEAYLNYLNSQLLIADPTIMINNTAAIFEGFIQTQMPKKLYNVLLKFYFNNSKKLGFPHQELQKVQNTPFTRYFQMRLRKLWNELHQDHIPEFVTIFELQQIISQNEVDNFILHHINKFKEDNNDKLQYERVFRLIKAFGYNQQLLDIFIRAIPLNDNCSRVADYIKQAKLNPEDYPEVQQQLIKSHVRFISHKYPWEKVEDLLQDDPELLAQYITITQSAIPIKASIARNYQLIEKQLIQDEQLKQDIIAYNGPIIINKLLKKDQFTSSDNILDVQQKKYMDLEYFKIQQDQVYFIDEDNNDLSEAIDILLHSQITGLDTEGGGQSIGLKKNTKNQNQIGLLQIATEDQVFLFDCQQLSESQRFHKFVKQYLESPQLIIGLALDDDLNKLVNIFQRHQKDDQIIINQTKVRDISTIYKQQNKNDSKSNLSHITKQYFGKSLSKLDQISDWRRRPLRLAQMHYAALDALICVKLYHKLIASNVQAQIA